MKVNLSNSWKVVVK